MLPPVRITDRDELRQAVRDAIARDGPNCDLNYIDVSGVTRMSRLFDSLPFQGDISRWDVSNVADFSCMFLRTPFNGDLSQWDTRSALDMSQMFQKSEFQGDISNWNVAMVLDFSQMFQESQFNGDLSRWDVARAAAFDNMFLGSTFRGDLASWQGCTSSSWIRFIDMEALPFMKEPMFMHWYYASINEGMFTPEDVLQPSWLQHFYRVKPAIDSIAAGLDASLRERASMYQQSWLHAATADDILALPALDE